MSQKFASRYLMGVYVVHKVEFEGNDQFDEDIVISATYPFINES
jgi:hypothetical protein